MAITIGDVTRALDRARLKYHQVDDKAVVLGMGGKSVDLKLLLLLEEGGEYLSLNAVDFATCPPGHAALERVLEAMCLANYRYRVLKLGWNEEDGSIRPEASIAIEDATSLDDEQLTDLIGYFCAGCDVAHVAIQEALGSPPPRAAPARGGGSTGSRPPTNPATLLIGIGVTLLGLACLVGVLFMIFR